jgi:pyruvate carboxylase
MDLLVANRGEVAIRVMRAAAELGMRTLAVFSEDDARSLHTQKADQAEPLRGTGAAAYLDAEQIVALAKQAGCDAIHPGYGFLSENAAFARHCAEEGITFVGPRAETLDLLGSKGQARALAERCGVPILPGTSGPTSLDQAREFLETLGDGGSIMIKALAGGGGRGMRPVHHARELANVYTRCQSEAQAAFGDGRVYVERLIPRARHIEVQVVGDRSGGVSHLWERECSIQRQNQKIIEVAPSPGLSGGLRDRLTAAAVRLAEEVRYESLGTFEFLVDEATFAFNEANPRLQVEHTVTEEVTGIDLVKVQLQLAAGRSLAELGLQQADVPEPRGFAMQVRINMETMGEDGIARPAGGTLTAFEVPSGPGLRVDSYGYVGYTASPRFDSLLAKLVGYSPTAQFAELVTRVYRALCEFKIEGVPTNIAFLQGLLKHPDVAANRVYTRFVEEHIAELVAPGTAHRRLFFDQPAGPALAGATVDAIDPLAVLDYGKTGAHAPALATHDAPDLEGPAGTVAIRAPMQGTIVGIDVQEGDLVHEGQQLLVMDAMKVEHVVTADTSGVVQYVAVSRGDAVFEGHPLVFIQEAEVEASEGGAIGRIDPDRVRPDLAEAQQRHAVGLDPARPDAVARRTTCAIRAASSNTGRWPLRPNDSGARWRS